MHRPRHRTMIASIRPFCRLILGLTGLALALFGSALSNCRASDVGHDVDHSPLKQIDVKQVDIPALVVKLGDDLFAVREAASNELIERGVTARPQLTAALESTDAEVRFRAKHILAVVVEADFQRRLRDFSADADGKLNLSMPGWTAFKQLAGSDRTARDVFVEMQQAEAGLLEAYEAGPQQAKEKMRTIMAGEPGATDRAAMMAGIRQRRQMAAPTERNLNLGSVLAWLFVAGDPT